MYGITDVREIGPLPELSDEAWANRRFPSPDGVAELRFHSPFEFAMASWWWKVNLRLEGKIVGAWDEAGEPDALVPWAYDGTLVAFPQSSGRGNRIVVADRSGNVVRGPRWPRDEWIFGLQWAPDCALCLVVGDEHVLVFDSTRRRISAVEHESGGVGKPVAGWLPGSVLWTLTGERRTKLGFYDGRSGHRLSVVTLDPETLVPYDAAQFRDVPRLAYSLDIAPGTAAVGALLDNWSRVEYAPDVGELALCVYRPSRRKANRPVTEELGSGLPVEERWVAVKLGATSSE